MDFFSSFWLFFKVRFFFLKEARKVRSLFPEFLAYELAFKKAYRFRNSFAICRQFLKERGEKCIHAYGETPLCVFAQIAKECDLNRKDLLIELGCGRGLGAVFLSCVTGCRVIGIDWVPFFIATAKRIVQSFPSLSVEFLCQEIHLYDFSKATALYLYGTCLPDKEIIQLAEQFESLPASTKIITVSYPLSDFNSQFSTVKRFNAVFPWGETEVFLNSSKKIPSSLLAE